MKNLLLLFIVPFLSYSQISFSDLKQINSASEFRKIMLLKGFEKIPYSCPTSDSGKYAYGYNISQTSGYGGYDLCFIDIEAYYYNSGYFTINFSIGYTEMYYASVTPVYHRVINEIKSSCTFVDVRDLSNGQEALCYSCPGSKYPGLIGFYTNGGRGTIFTIKK
tara:strand:+ start:684 stop:1175 length:492 start_codon:yes stop_codon:yes gene_type:complete